MRKRLILAFLLMGFSFTIIQGLMIRELLVSFYGNELSIGLILGNWLVLEAIGSGLIGRLVARYHSGSTSYALLQILLALMLPLSLYGAFTARNVVGVTAGQGVGLGGIFSSSLLILAPLGLVDGAMFTFGVQALAQLTGREVPSIGRVYTLEAAGGIIGGLIFTYLLIPYLSSLRIVLLLTALNLLSAISLLPPRSPSFPLTTLLLLATSAVLLSPLAGTLHRWLVDQQWGRYKLAPQTASGAAWGPRLVGYENSVYGNVAVVQEAGQYTFFTNGLPVLTAPVPNVQGVEELVHLPFLFHPGPKRVLVVSGGVGGVLHEILKYPVERVDYAELDPLLIRMVQRFPTPLTESELSDPRVHIHFVDGRLLVRQMSPHHPLPTLWPPPLSAPLSPQSWGERGERGGGEDYDVIIVNLPYPSTLQLNRFYTVEFFRMARQLLAPEGILVLTTPGSLTHMGPEMRELNALLERTLRVVFPAIVVVPGETHLWIASPSSQITTLTIGELVARWQQRHLQTRMVSDFHIRLKMDKQRLKWFWDSLAKVSGHEVNSDLHPAGLLRGLAYWNALFSPSLTHPFALLSRMTLRTLLLPLALLVGLLLIFGWPVRLRPAIPIAIVTTGVGGMAFDLIAIFAFQVFYGYVYQQIGLLITAFMAGLTLGGLLMTRRLARTPQAAPEAAREPRFGRDKSWLIGLEVTILLYCVALPLFFLHGGPSALSTLPPPLLRLALLALNALAGFLVGSEFPLANRILSSLRGGLTGASGLLYACDLAGAFAGSVLVSVVFIPALGILQTCVLIAALKLISLVGVAVGGLVSRPIGLLVC